MESHLLQMRGLKPNLGRSGETSRMSHLLQMRGLKHKKLSLVCENGFVASFTDAWIETTINCLI